MDDWAGEGEPAQSLCGAREALRPLRRGGQTQRGIQEEKPNVDLRCPITWPRLNGGGHTAHRTLTFRIADNVTGQCSPTVSRNL